MAIKKGGKGKQQEIPSHFSLFYQSVSPFRLYLRPESQHRKWHHEESVFISARALSMEVWNGGRQQRESFSSGSILSFCLSLILARKRPGAGPAESQAKPVSESERERRGKKIHFVPFHRSSC